MSCHLHVYCPSLVTSLGRALTSPVCQNFALSFLIARGVTPSLFATSLKGSTAPRNAVALPLRKIFNRTMIEHYHETHGLGIALFEFKQIMTSSCLIPKDFILKSQLFKRIHAFETIRIKTMC